MVRVLVVDPRTRTIAEARVPVDPGNDEQGFGAQIKQDALTAVIGSDVFEWNDVAPGLTAVADASFRDDAYYHDEDVEALRRRRRGDDRSRDHRRLRQRDNTWIDAKLTLDEAREAIRWAGDADADEGEEGAEDGHGKAKERQRR
jgi:hypothetical protein